MPSASMASSLTLRLASAAAGSPRRGPPRFGFAFLFATSARLATHHSPVVAADLRERATEPSAAKVEAQIAIEDANARGRCFQYMRRDRGRLDETPDTERQLRGT